MKRQFRLQKDQDFQRVWESGAAWTHPLVVLRARPNQLPYTRCGFVTGKKIGGAVQRNRAKRRLREAVRARFERVVTGYDLVWIARVRLNEAPFVEVSKAVEALLERSGLLTS
ncbi:MAG TPA: ribonuclease P protein component [Anaerolineae bacterium]